MKSSRVISVVVAICFSLVMAGVAAAADKGPETITFKCEKKGDVAFSHVKHQESATCGDCHHSESPDGKQVPYAEGQKIEKCGTCHTAEMAAPALNSSKKALHKNCKGCHKAAVKEGKTAPTKCAGCHPKKAAK
ncbi:MAG: cytochrome c3 family protein [Deltaproteobacteria bacterium]|nr:cytochrome c3 family protein [Deltaproteobacteria bacterium]MBW1946833.1 cytochrome c3 family protein [Deltaproteobacteria bacterium]MBW1967650.1 cytochrome c3 family protein [Deltaproteobacteria bacterium]MBW2098979.1 cytochrome c3 family protein [Deltaproteobacteria bacterium]PXF54848.1 MAG: class III cytochrome c [Deltaproteobacteria bacterium]